MLHEFFIRRQLIELLKLELQYLDFMIAEPDSKYMPTWENILRDCRSKIHALKWTLQDVEKI